LTGNGLLFLTLKRRVPAGCHVNVSTNRYLGIDIFRCSSFHLSHYVFVLNVRLDQWAMQNRVYDSRKYIPLNLYKTASFHWRSVSATSSYKLGLWRFIVIAIFRRTKYPQVVRHPVGIMLRLCYWGIVVSRAVHRKEQSTDISYLCTQGHVIVINISTCHRDIVLHGPTCSSPYFVLISFIIVLLTLQSLHWKWWRKYTKLICRPAVAGELRYLERPS
jgi:hypothetical protein